MGSEGDVVDKTKNFSGIPEAVFVEDVEAFMSLAENDNNVEQVLRKLDEQHSKYKFMEFNIQTKRRKLKIQIPEITKSLQMLDILRKQEDPNETQFLLSEQVFVKTVVPPTKTVGLWLGANVMLEYSLDEAEKLLRDNFNNATQLLSQLDVDNDFLRDQITTTEVNMARIHNWHVKKRTAQKGAP